MKNIIMLTMALPLFILGAVLAVHVNIQTSAASMVIDPQQKPTISLYSTASKNITSQGETADMTRISLATDTHLTIRQNLAGWTLAKLPIATPIHLPKKTLQITAVFLIGFGLFGLSSFLRDIFKVDKPDAP